MVSTVFLILRWTNCHCRRMKRNSTAPAACFFAAASRPVSLIARLRVSSNPANAWSTAITSKRRWAPCLHVSAVSRRECSVLIAGPLCFSMSGSLAGDRWGIDRGLVVGACRVTTKASSLQAFRVRQAHASHPTFSTSAGHKLRMEVPARKYSFWRPHWRTPVCAADMRM